MSVEAKRILGELRTERSGVFLPGDVSRTFEGHKGRARVGLLAREAVRRHRKWDDATRCYRHEVTKRVEPEWGVEFLDAKGKVESTVFATDLSERLIDFVLAVIHTDALEVVQGDSLDIVINQGSRYCQIVGVKKTRARIEYEMPNAGVMGGYIPVVRCGGRTHWAPYLNLFRGTWISNYA